MCETLTLIPNDRRSAIINHPPSHQQHKQSGAPIFLSWGGDIPRGGGGESDILTRIRL
jgi:hypothetical protein